MNGEAFQGVLRWKVMEAVEILKSEPQGKKIWAFVGPIRRGENHDFGEGGGPFSAALQQRDRPGHPGHLPDRGDRTVQTYAGSCGCLLKPPAMPETLKEVIGRHQDCDLLLARHGRTESAPAGAAGGNEGVLSADPRVETIWCQRHDQRRGLGGHRRAVLRFADPSYVFTKIDETEE